MEDINVVLYDLPPGIRGFVRNNPDNSYTIVINAKHSRAMQRQCFLHELKHIKDGDFECGAGSDAVEARAHEKSPSKEGRPV